MNDLSSPEFGLLRRQIRDVSAMLGIIDHRTRKLGEPELRRPGGLCARMATVALLSRMEKRPPDAIVKQHFSGDRELAQLLEFRSASGPAMTGTAGFAAELAATAVEDLATNLLPQSALVQLRALSGQPYAFIDGAANIRIPVHAPAPSGGFIPEGGAIPVGALILTAMNLKPRKAASLVAITRELLAGTSSNVEISLRSILQQDLGLAIDNVLLGSGAATAAQPPGLLAGLTSLPPTAGGGYTALMGDIKNLCGAIAPAIRPCLIVGSSQAGTLGSLEPPIALPTIVAPYLAANTAIVVDAAAFASALGVPDFATDENPALHMESAAPLPIVGGTAQPPVIGSVAAPVQSLWQIAAVGMRTLVDADWTLRRAPGAVAYISGVTW